MVTKMIAKDQFPPSCLMSSILINPLKALTAYRASAPFLLTLNYAPGAFRAP